MIPGKNAVLAYISSEIVYKIKKVIISFYSGLVRPQLEYHVQFWTPNIKKDVVNLDPEVSDRDDKGIKMQAA